MKWIDKPETIETIEIKCPEAFCLKFDGVFEAEVVDVTPPELSENFDRKYEMILRIFRNAGYATKHENIFAVNENVAKKEAVVRIRKILNNDCCAYVRADEFEIANKLIEALRALKEIY